MGGSGGGRGSSIGDLSDLRQMAKEEIARGSDSKRNVFISFAAEDLYAVQLLRGQAANDLSEIEFSDWSVKTAYESQNADYIRGRIKERIQHASVTLVYVSDDTAQSKWVDWEIRTSIDLGKQVLAVHKGSSSPKSLPRAVLENKIKVISWSSLGEELKKL